MIKRILSASIILLLVFILGCSEISALTEDLANTSSAANPEITTKVERGSKWQMNQMKINEKTVIFLTLAPDLIIETITWSPENPSKGDSVTFSVTIKNQGSGKASNSRVYFYIDGSSRGYQEVQRLDAGATVTKTFTWTAQAGSHTIKAIVDKENWIPESDETNNEKTVIFSTLAPDLIIETITWSPANPLESDNVTFTVTIKNQGSGKADYSRVAYYIDDAYLTSASVNQTDPGASDNKTFSWIAQAGSHVIKAVADSNERVIESDETNNEKTVTFPTLAPDLIIETITWSPASPSVGETVTFSVIIKNQGSARAGFSRVYFYVDDSSIGYRRVQEMYIGDTDNKTFTWTTQAGSHTIKAVADKESWIPETDEDNNEKTVTFSGAPSPDLTIETITWSPASPSVGETVTFTVTIKNQGSGKADYSYVAYYIDNAYLTSAYVNPIDPGATDNKTFTWTAQADTHTIKAVADSNTRIPESDENNNEKTAIYPIVPPDLIIETITWSPASPSESDNVTFTVTIKNQGSDTADYSHVAYYIDDAYLTSTSVNPIDPGATDNKTFTWIAQAGTHTIKAVADSNNEVTESDENNNEKTAIYPTAPPDLTIETITWSPASPSESDNVTFTVTIKNQGSGKADYSYVAYYIDDAYLTSASVNPIDPGAIDKSTFTWTAQAGSHAIKAVADSNARIPESDENNNEKTETFSVSLPPAPTPAAAPAPRPKPQEIPAGKPTPFPSLGKGIWLDLLFVLAVVLLAGTFIMAILRSRQQ